MSTRVGFARLPRVAQDYTSTIVSIEREMQSTEDQTITDAWKNGGTFQGHQVTDDMILKYWHTRQSSLDKHDPLYEEMSNQVTQLEYGIAQSKQDVLYRQKKISDSQYANFFLSWAKKVPRNSEFYRTLQKDAAGLIESSRANARRAADKAKKDAFNQFVDSTTKSDIAIGSALTDAVDGIAKQSGLDLEGDGAQILDLLTKDIKFNPTKYRLLLDAIHTGDPHWNGQITTGYFSKAVQSATTGYRNIATRAKKEGYASPYQANAKAEQTMAMWGADVKVWTPAQSYNSAYSALMETWGDPNASQPDKDAAAKIFADSVTNTANKSSIDPVTKSMMLADVTRVLGGDAGDTPSFGGAILSHTGVDEKMAAQAKFLLQQKTAIQTNPEAFVYAPTDKNGLFDPTGKGPLGVVSRNEVGPNAIMVAVPQLGGSAVMAAVSQHPVYAVDPNNPSASPQQVGTAVSWSVGGKQTTWYAYTDSNNKPHWSEAANAPWAKGVVPTADSKGDTYLTMPSTAAADPMAQAAAIDKAQGTHFVDAIKNGATSHSEEAIGYQSQGGHQTGTATIKYENGEFKMVKTTRNTSDFTNATTGKADSQVEGTTTTTLPIGLDGTIGEAAFDKFIVIDPSRQTLGAIPGVTYSSPLAGSIASANGGLSSDQTSHLASLPEFQQAFLLQTASSLGLDPNNPETLVDPRLTSAWTDVTTLPQSAASNSTALGERTAGGQLAQQRTDLTFPGTNQPKAALQGSMSINFGKGQEMKLPGLPSYLGQKTLNVAAITAQDGPKIPFNPLFNTGPKTLGSRVGEQLGPVHPPAALPPPPAPPPPVIPQTAPSQPSKPAATQSTPHRVGYD